MRAFALCLLVVCSCTRSQISSEIEAELEHTKAIDNHAHPMKVVERGEVDREFDALPADAIQQPALPVPSRPTNPMFAEASQALFGSEPRAVVAKAHGDSYPVWILNHTNTEIMLANRVAMGRGLSGDRFKWVPFVDTFLFPLNNTAIKNKDPEHAAFMKNEEALLLRYLDGALLASSLDDYLVFVTHTLEKFKSDGAVALKFELAYLRDLDIGNPKKEDVERIYAIYQQPSEASPEEYKALQDYIFRYIAHEGGRLALPIHIHTSIGVGSYFRAANANALALEPLFNDPSLRKTKFVMLHAAWPFTREAATLILKPNVFVDYSAFYFLTYAHPGAKELRFLLEMAPEKVLYGSDASPFSDKIGWEETAWMGSKVGRNALGFAVTSMIEDGEITVDEGKKLVHMVLRDNARQLYGF
jgi:hypothetical protein